MSSAWLWLKGPETFVEYVSWVHRNKDCAEKGVTCNWIFQAFLSRPILIMNYLVHLCACFNDVPRHLKFKFKTYSLKWKYTVRHHYQSKSSDQRNIITQNLESSLELLNSTWLLFYFHKQQITKKSMRTLAISESPSPLPKVPVFQETQCRNIESQTVGKGGWRIQLPW